MRRSTPQIKEEQQEEGGISTASAPTSPSLLPAITPHDEEYIAHLSHLFHNEPFPKIQSILETATHYHSPTLPLSTFANLITLITNALLNRPFLLKNPTFFAPWALNRIQQCLENITELYTEDIETLVPLLSFETNKYGSTLLDRFLPILEKKTLRNPSLAVVFVDRVIKAAEEGEVSQQGKLQVLEAVKTALSMMFFKDDRSRVGDEEEEEEEEEGDAGSAGGNSRPSTAHSSTANTSTRPMARTPSPRCQPQRPRPLPLTLSPPPHRVPKLTGASLAMFFTHYLTTSQPDAVRSILWNMQLSLPAHSFRDFTRLHFPMLERLLPQFPRYGIEYSDMVLQKYCYGVFYRVLHHWMWTEPTVASSSPGRAKNRGTENEDNRKEKEIWQNRVDKVRDAFRRLDHSALRQILRERYEEFKVLADGSIKKRSSMSEDEMLPMQSIEHEELGRGAAGVFSSSPPTPLAPPWLVRTRESAESSARSDVGDRSGGEGGGWRGQSRDG